MDVIQRWYQDSDDTIHVADGTTAQGLGFVILEWEECEIEPAFLVVLAHDPNIEEYSIYARGAEYE